MRTLDYDHLSKLQGGNKTDQKAGWVCGAAIGLSVIVGALSGGVGLIAMVGGAAVPACGAAAGALFYGN